MAVDKITSKFGKWTWEEIGSNTYGGLSGTINEALGLAIIKWGGNSTAPGTTTYSFSLPAKFKPKENFVVVVRNGDSMEVRTDLNVNVSLTGRAWSGASLMYPLY